jgi:hypothetical protein
VSRTRKGKDLERQCEPLGAIQTKFVTVFTKIEACAAEAHSDTLSRSLMNAYVACLSFDGLTELAVASLNAATKIRRAVRTRLNRMAERTLSASQLETFAQRLVSLTPADRHSRTTIDVLLSDIYARLPPPTRQVILHRWIDTGKRGPAARWLKAIKDDTMLFDAAAILSYWRATRDRNAAVVLALKADPMMLQPLLRELIHNVHEGWIIRRAAVRVGFLPEDCWEDVRQSSPVTYLYLCALLNRPVEVEEAVQLVRQLPGTFDSDRGLAIWSLGQMGLEKALDEIYRAREEMREEDLAAAGSKYGLLPERTDPVG